MNTLDEIKNRIDIVDLVSESVKLRRTGKNYTGFCPFHANTRTPAFVVWPETGTWRCFGECNEGGDIFRYVMKKEGVDFKEALKMLAERAGIELRPLTPQVKEQNERSDALRKILEEAVVFYRHQIRNTDAGHAAQAYLREKRGISADTEEVWGLGYAPDSYDATLEYFKKKGYSVQDLVDAGLLTERDDSRVYDKFRHRLMIPIRDMNGKMAGFGGRVLNPDDVPKFMNSPQTILFDKSATLFGLDKARRAIRAANQAVIVEGYFDVIVPHQEGFQNVISPMGTALTEAQMQLLKRFTRRFVMALDPDAAGLKGTLRGLEVARGALEHERDPIPNAHGLLRTISRLNADLRVSSLPNNLDPDEIVLSGAEEWQKVVNSAQPIIYYFFETLLAGKDIEDPKVKSSIANQILPLVEDIGNRIERDEYRQFIARKLKIDEITLELYSMATPKPRPKSRRRKSEAPSISTALPVEQSSEQDKVNRIEQEIIAFLSIEPENKYRLDRFLRKCGLKQLSLPDFIHTENQEMIRVVFDSLAQDKEEPSEFIKGRIDLSQLITEINHSPQPDEDEKKGNVAVRQLEETARLILLMRQVNVNQELKGLQFLQAEQTDDEGKPSPSKEIQGRLVDLIRLRGLLDRALAKPVSID